MKVKVTDDHIRAGIRYNSYQCPVGIAIREKMALLGEEVGRYDVCVKVDAIVIRERLSLPTPESVVDFILLFDRGYNTRPFEFEIDYPGGG